jgi:hypothetical protein
LPSDYKAGSSKKVWWKCSKGIDHEWLASVGKRVNGRGCPVCRGLKVVKSNSLLQLKPLLAKEWHTIKNVTRTPEKVTVGSGYKAWWQCPKGDDHVWQAAVSTRAINNSGCPVCAGLKVVGSNAFSTTHPIIAKEWHHRLNQQLLPNNVVAGSEKKVWWQCSKDENHIWKTSVYHRTMRATSCPYCSLTPQSRQELTITFELNLFFDINPRGFKTRVEGKLWTIDIFIKELNLGIEFDGNYWHKDKRALDQLKTEKLQADGFQIMRIREEPLKPITEIDVVSMLPFNAKKVTNQVLKHILNAYEIDLRRMKKIKEYFVKSKLQNEKGLNEYIDLILEEKSKKKQKRTITSPVFPPKN